MDNSEIFALRDECGRPTGGACARLFVHVLRDVGAGRCESSVSGGGETIMLFQSPLKTDALHG